jgi:HKD family nuclease
MAKIEILLQGFQNKDYHATAINDLLEMNNVNNYLFSIAFVRKLGVEAIIENLKNVTDKIELFIGIRNGITSIQAILLLQKIGIHPYVVDTATNYKIFHPKIYAAYNDYTAHVILGSANLTAGGLSQNIEASSYISLDRKQPEDNDYINKLLGTIQNLPNQYPQHVFKLSSPKQAVLLLRQGRLEDERVIKRANLSTRTITQRDKLAPIPTMIKSIGKSKKPAKGKVIKTEQEGILVWESKPLTERSLNIPQADNTNITGDINLGKGLMKEIDFKHYFREVVFEDINWYQDKQSKFPHLERARIPIEIIIKNNSYGVFELELTHDPRTDTKSYQQNNVMTKIKWGKARAIIAQKDLLGRTLKLYKYLHNKFIIVID